MKWIRALWYFLEALLFRFYREGDKLKALKNQWEGQPALIVGNGPSLNKMNLDEFKGVNSIGMNKINLAFEGTEWRPSLITCVNRHVAAQNQGFFGSTDIPVLLSWQARRFIKRKSSAQCLFFLNSDRLFFSRDISEILGAGATVTYTAIQVAHYLGANPIILIGVDHNFVASGKPHELQTREGQDVNHFHPEYFADGVKWNLPDLDMSEKAYRLARETLEARGIDIFDATVGGKLQVFPKINLDKARDLLKVANEPGGGDSR